MYIKKASLEIFQIRHFRGRGILADLTVSKNAGTSYQIEIHFAVVNHFVKLVELSNCLK